MKKFGFNEEMIEMLSSLKGKTLKSFEWESIEPGRFPMYAVRINTGRFALDIINDVPEDAPEEDEEVSCLICEKKEIDSVFYYEVPTKKYAINEKIKNVSIVTDTINEEGVTAYVMDVAVLIQTEYTTFSISKTWFMGEVIEVNYDGIFYAKEKALNDWRKAFDEGITLNRTIKVL